MPPACLLDTEPKPRKFYRRGGRSRSHLSLPNSTASASKTRAQTSCGGNSDRGGPGSCLSLPSSRPGSELSLPVSSQGVMETGNKNKSAAGSCLSLPSGDSSRDATRRRICGKRPPDSEASLTTKRELDLEDLEDMQETTHRPDVAPYPRRGNEWRKAAHLPQQEQVWYCPLCQYEIRIPPGPVARKKLRETRSNHLHQRHSKAERQKVPRLGSVTELVTATHDLPQEMRNWTCHLCGKGLPALPCNWHDSSIRNHFEAEHPDCNPKEAYHQKQREDPEVRRRMAHRGAHVGQWMQAKQMAKLQEWKAQTDHDLSYLVFRDVPSEGNKRNQNKIMWLVCAQCKRKDSPCLFQRNPRCVPKSKPHARLLACLRPFCSLSQRNFDAAALALGISSSEEELLGRRPAHSQSHEPYAGVRIGEATNPGPRARGHGAVQLRV